MTDSDNRSTTGPDTAGPVTASSTTGPDTASSTAGPDTISSTTDDTSDEPVSQEETTGDEDENSGHKVRPKPSRKFPTGSKCSFPL